jgi:hypothetical protein
LPAGATFEGCFASVTAEITDYVSGSARVFVGGDATPAMSDVLSSNGIFSFNIGSGSGSSQIGFYTGTSFTGTIRLLSAKLHGGNHASQPTATKRPILQESPFGGVRNLLTYTEDFGNAAWVKGDAALGAMAQAPDGSFTAQTVSLEGQYSGISTAITIAPVIAPYVVSLWARKVSGDNEVYITTTQPANSVTTPLSLDGQWKMVEATTTTIDAYGFLEVIICQDRSATGHPTVVEIWHPQVELGSTATPYQKVTNQYTVTEAGVPSIWSLKFDGIDDFMSTAAIDFSGTDKISAWCGVTKVDDTARIVAELSADSGTNAGSFYIVTGTDAGFPQAYSSLSRGEAPATIQQTAVYTDVPAPDTAALTITHDISGDLSTIKRNGVAGTDGTADKGAGNFGNYPLYIASRAGTSLFFNGNLYPTIIAGALYDQETIDKMNEWTAQKTGVTL